MIMPSLFFIDFIVNMTCFVRIPGQYINWIYACIALLFACFLMFTGYINILSRNCAKKAGL